MPVIGGSNPTVNIQLPVPAPAPMTKKPKQPAPAAPPQPTPAAAPPVMQAPPPGLGGSQPTFGGQPVPPGIPPPQPTAFLLPWMPEAPKQRPLPMRRLHGPRRYMDTGEALIRAIRENPTDWTAPLAFADYLEENGHSAVAEVIRRAHERNQSPGGWALQSYALHKDHPYSLPEGAPVGVPHAYLPNIWRDANGNQMAGVNVVFPFPLDRAKGRPTSIEHRYSIAPRGVGISVPVKEAYRLFSKMRDEGVINAEKPVAWMENLHINSPNLLRDDPEKMKRGSPRRYMDTGESLLKAIQDNPHDKTIQGAFGDYLEEQAPHLATPTVLARLRSPDPMWVGMSPKGKVLAIPFVSKKLFEQMDAQSQYSFGWPSGEFWHISSRNNKGQAHRVRRSGRMQTWKTRPNEFRVPWKHGLYQNGEFTHHNAHEWLTEDPTGEPS